MTKYLEALVKANADLHELNAIVEAAANDDHINHAEYMFIRDCATAKVKGE